MRKVAKWHPVVAFFALAFAIAWGVDALRLLLGMESGLPAVLMLEISGSGPSLAGLLVARVAYGTRGLRELFGRALKWRVGLRWYLLVLVVFPAILVGVIAGSTSLSGGAFRLAIPLWILPAFFVATIFLGPLQEELGWRAFAMPLLMERYGWLKAGLVLGVAWALWHQTPTAWFGLLDPDGGLGGLILGAVAPDVALGILMAWVFFRAGGSALLAGIGMHTAANFVLFLPAGQADPAVTWAVTSSFAACLAVLAVAVVACEKLQGR